MEVVGYGWAHFFLADSSLLCYILHKGSYVIISLVFRVLLVCTIVPKGIQIFVEWMNKWMKSSVKILEKCPQASGTAPSVLPRFPNCLLYLFQTLLASCPLSGSSPISSYSLLEWLISNLLLNPSNFPRAINPLPNCLHGIFPQKSQQTPNLSTFQMQSITLPPNACIFLCFEADNQGMRVLSP